MAPWPDLAGLVVQAGHKGAGTDAHFALRRGREEHLTKRESKRESDQVRAWRVMIQIFWTVQPDGAAGIVLS
jgi:hypothetical protein